MIAPLSQAFFKQHPEYAKNNFYITGESYAGHYIPALASRVLQGNKNKEGTYINLKVRPKIHQILATQLCPWFGFDWQNIHIIDQGLAIGNGLTNPGIQYKAYPDYALDMKVISQSDYNTLQKSVADCDKALKPCGNF